MICCLKHCAITIIGPEMLRKRLNTVALHQTPACVLGADTHSALWFFKGCVAAFPRVYVEFKGCMD